MKHLPFSCSRVFLFSLLSLTISLAQSSAQESAPARLAADGWGMVKIGVTIVEAERALGTRLQIDKGASGSDECVDAWAGPMKNPAPPLGFRFIKGHLAVISVRDASITTDRGIRIGDPESKVLAAYGSKLERTPEPYYDDSDPHHQLYFWLAPDRGLLFRIDENGGVWSIEAGTAALRAMEGCA